MERRAVSVGGPTLRDTMQAAKDAEDAGFTHCWFNDNTGVDGYIGLTAMALNTKKIILGSGIARAFVRAPSVTAVAAADLDEISEGRFVLGIAGGTKRQNMVESSVFVEHPIPQMRELFEILRAAWARTTPGPLKYDGKFYQLDIRQFRRSKAYQPTIPIYMAAVQEKMIQFTGETCDGLAGHPVNSIRYIKEFIEPNLAIGMKKSGRKREDFDLSTWLLTAISTDRAQARREAAAQIAFYLSTRSYSYIADSQGWQKERMAIQEAFHVKRDMNAMYDAVSDEMIDAMSLAGTKDEVLKKYEAWKEVVQLPTFQAPGTLMSGDRKIEAQHLINEVFGQS